MTTAKIIYYKVNDGEDEDKEVDVDEKAHKDLMKKLMNLNQRTSDIKEKVETQKVNRLESHK